MGLWVEAPPHPAPVADLSREPVEAPPPVANSSPAKLSVTSSQSGGSIEVLADGRSESSESVWDYDERPLTQVSLKRSLEDSRQEYRDAPPAAANWLMLPFPKISRICPCLSKRCGDQSVRLRLGKWHPSSFVISAPERSMCGVLCDGSMMSFV